MVFIDTGFLVALIKPTDELHIRARSWADLIEEPLLVTEYVLWETVNFLSRRDVRGRVQKLIERIQSDSRYTIISASNELFDVGMQMHVERQDKEWSLTDCISFHLMRQHRITRALTYDMHFEQAGFVALLREDPS